MFDNTLKLVDDAGFAYLHVFPFSPRARTPAARMPQVPKPVIKQRAAQLRAKGALALDARLRSLVGTEQTLLVEKDNVGRTACFAQARFAGSAPAGAFVRARVHDSTGTQLIAELR